jgi:hypothetical protein
MLSETRSDSACALMSDTNVRWSSESIMNNVNSRLIRHLLDLFICPLEPDIVPSVLNSWTLWSRANASRLSRLEGLFDSLSSTLLRLFRATLKQRKDGVDVNSGPRREINGVDPLPVQLDA